MKMQTDYKMTDGSIAVDINALTSNIINDNNERIEKEKRRAENPQEAVGVNVIYPERYVQYLQDKKSNMYTTINDKITDAGKRRDLHARIAMCNELIADIQNMQK